MARQVDIAWLESAGYCYFCGGYGFPTGAACLGMKRESGANPEQSPLL